MNKLFLAFAASLIVCGCGSGGTGLSQADEQKASRLDQIAKQSGGDWSKVSDADKQYVINDISHGSEQSAKRLIEMKGHGPAKPMGRPGGPASK